MDPHKVLGIAVNATEQEVRQAYLDMVSKYHPDHGGDAWVFEQIQTAYEQLTRSTSTQNALISPAKSPSSSAREDHLSSEAFPNETDNSMPRGHFLFRQLPLQTETAWFILLNVLDLVLTNILLQNNAIEANPLANMVFVNYGFVGMIAFKLASVFFVCLAAQIIATRSLSKAKSLLWFGCLVVGAVLLYSSRLILSLG